jgi:hypothetical protein
MKFGGNSLGKATKIFLTIAKIEENAEKEHG